MKNIAEFKKGQRMASWKPSGEICPECELQTEVLSDNELNYAERCPQCDWLIRFDEDDGYLDVEGD